MDTAARGATSLPTISYHLRPSLQQLRLEAKTTVKKETLQAHKVLRTTSASMSWYGAATGYKDLDPSLLKVRRQAVALHRLRLGFKCVTERIPGMGPHHCEHCGSRSENPLTHYLLHCQATQAIRRTYGTQNGGREEDRAARLVKEAMEDPETLLRLIRDKPPPR